MTDQADAPAFLETLMASTVANARTAWTGFTTARTTFRRRLFGLMVGYVAANAEADAKLASKYVVDLFGDDAKVSTFANYRSKVRTFLQGEGVVALVRKEIGEPSLLTTDQFTAAVETLSDTLLSDVDWGDAKAKATTATTATTDETTTTEGDPNAATQGEPDAMPIETAAMVGAKALAMIGAAAILEPGGVAHMILQKIVADANAALGHADAELAKVQAKATAKARAAEIRRTKRAA